MDGTAPAMLVERIGGHVIRGSSTATGARALRDYYETIVKQEISPAITPDGPRDRCTSSSRAPCCSRS